MAADAAAAAPADDSILCSAMRRNTMAQTAEDTGLPGKPRTGTAPRRAEQQRLARPHGDLPEIQRHALTAERLLHKVVVADRSTAGGHQQVQPGGLAHARGQRRAIVGADAEIDRRRRPSLRASRPDSHGVRAGDLAAFGRLARPAQLVAGGEQADAGPAPHRQPEVAHARRRGPAPARRAGCRRRALPSRGESRGRPRGRTCRAPRATVNRTVVAPRSRHSPG